MGAGPRSNANTDNCSEWEPGTAKSRTRSSYDEYRYSEEWILSVARELRRDGKQRRSENPRLYIVLRDIDQNLGTNQPGLIDKFIDEGINDTWLPISASNTILDHLLLNWYDLTSSGHNVVSAFDPQTFS